MSFDGSTNYLYTNTAFIGGSYSLYSSQPHTYCAWIKSSSFTTSHIMGEVYPGWPLITYMGIMSTGKLTFNFRSNANWPLGWYQTTTALATNTWGHAAYVVKENRSANDIAVYLNGGSMAAASYTYRQGPTPNRGSIGAYYNGDSKFNGLIAWPAMWNVELSLSEIQSLAAGVHPTMIRPDNLRMFSPFGNLDPDTVVDTRTGRTFTQYGSATWSDDSPAGLIYPSQQIIGVSQGIVTPAVQHARLRIGV